MCEIEYVVKSGDGFVVRADGPAVELVGNRSDPTSAAMVAARFKTETGANVLAAKAGLYGIETEVVRLKISKIMD